MRFNYSQPIARVNCSLITAMSNCKQRQSSSSRMLLRACIKGDMSIARSILLVEKGAVNAKNCNGLSCLQMALIHQHHSIAKLLLKEHIDVLSRDKCGWTALHDAALFNCQEIVNELLAMGASLTEANELGEIPIDIAGSVCLERLLCTRMAKAGHTELANEYCIHLGLSHLDEDIPCLSESLLTLEEIPEVVIPVISAKTTTEKHCDGSFPARSQVDPSGSFLYQDRAQKSASNVEDSSPAVNLISNPIEVIRPPSGNYEYSGHSLREAKAINTTGRHNTHVNTSPGCRQKVTSLSPLVEADAESVAANFPVRCVNDRRLSLGDVVSWSMSSSALRRFSLNFDSSRTMHLTTEEVARLNRLFQSRCNEQEDSCAADTRCKTPESERETPIDLLKMRPRKPSLIKRSHSRRRSGDGDARRSVTFQPEVLLQEIVAEGDVDLVKEIVCSGAIPDVNKMSPVGLTALHQSSLDGNLACARMLVLNGADVNNTDVDGWTPLHAAAATNHAEIVRFLLLAGADPSQKNEDGQTPYDLAPKGSVRRMLLRVASGKNIDAVEDDLSDGESDFEEEEEYSHVETDSDEDGSCLSDTDPKVAALQDCLSKMSASIKGVCRKGVYRGDSSDSVFADISNPCHIAASLLKDRDLSDSTSSYGSLIENDFDRHTSSEASSIITTVSTLCNDQLCLTDTDRETYFSEDQGISTMDASSDSSHRKLLFSDDEGTSHDVLDSELERGSLDHRFQESVLSCDVQGVVKLIKHKPEIDVNRINKTSGISALHHAVLEENYTIVQHLVCDFQCDLSLKDVEGWTPLHAASAVGNIRIAQFLLENGAKPSMLNHNCEFPVDVAEDEAMEELLKKAMMGASVGRLFKDVVR